MCINFDDIFLKKIADSNISTTNVSVETDENLKFDFSFTSVNEALYNYSMQYFNAAYLIFDMIAKKQVRHDVTDQCTIGMLFFLRHSVELMLKAIIYKQKGSNAIIVFNDCKHELSKLQDEISFSTLCDFEVDCMKSYFNQIDAIDSMGDLFRYPFDEAFLEKYYQKFFDFYAMFKIYALYYECLHFEYTEKKNEILDPNCIEETKRIRDDNNNQFIIEAPHGIGYFMIWEMDSDYPSYNQLEGYSKIGKYLYNYATTNTEGLEIYVPLMFTYLHLLEISMKDFCYNIHDHFKDEIENLEQKTGKESFKLYRDYMKSHLLHKKILDNVDAALKYLANEFNWTQDKINDYSQQITVIKDCDPKSEKFRYPINKSCQLFDYPVIYVDLFCKLCEQCFEITDNCSYVFDDMKEWYLEIVSDFYQ